MYTRATIGMILIFQAIGFVGLHNYVPNTWLAISIVCGLLGLVLVIKEGRRFGSSSDSDVDTSFWGADSDNTHNHESHSSLGDGHDW